MTEMFPPALPPTALRRRCDPATLLFDTTDALPDVEEALGQERAADAIRFGLTMPHPGYNLFLLGREGSGRHHLAGRMVREEAARRPRADDWCYVNDFAHPERPAALRLSAGDGPRLRDDIRALVDDLRAAIQAAFQGDELSKRRKALQEELRARMEAAMAALGEEASSRGLALLHSPENLALVPTRDGRPVPPEEVAEWPEAERDAVVANSRDLAGRVQALLEQFPRWQQAQREKLRAVERELTARAVTHLVDRLRARWSKHAEVVGYLDAVRADVIENATRLLHGEAGQGATLEAAQEPVDWQMRYQVNVLVEQPPDGGAPVVHEDNPTLPALVGRIEHRTHLGTMVTDFTRIRAGSLHRANGGFLVLDAASVLREPLAWHHLKRALRAGEIKIESLGEALALVTTVSLQPAPIPLSVKVVLVGEPRLYHLLSALDPEFSTLFKVMADVEPDAPRTPEHELHLAKLVATLVRAQGLRPFTADAVARVIDYASRVRGDAERLTTHMQTLDDLLREADHHAGSAGRATVDRDDVHQALLAAHRRAGLIQEQTQAALVRDLIHVETSGAVVGQVNGLMVVGVHPVPFGRPGRVSASVRPGTGQILDIEREVKLGGPIHSKGVLILGGFLGGRFAVDHPLALGATIVLEQSYGPVEGDSASLAEACALLSALSGLPLRQDVAVTGSLDQRGLVQAVGGVNEKVEGFFALCAARGLTGTQGVILPASVASFLMLDDAVVAAAEEGRFSVWPVGTIDEAMAVLTGLPAGVRDETGRFPTDTVNGRVQERLARLAEQAMAARSPGPGA